MKTKSRVPQPQEFPRGRCGQLLRTNCWPFLPTTKRPCTNVASLHTEGSPTLRAFVLGYWRRDQCARWSGGGGGGHPDTQPHLPQTPRNCLSLGNWIPPALSGPRLLHSQISSCCSAHCKIPHVSPQHRTGPCMLARAQWP